MSGIRVGLSLNKLKTRVQLAPPELSDAPKPQDEALDTEPSRVVTSMFQKKKSIPEKSVAPITKTATLEPKQHEEKKPEVKLEAEEEPLVENEEQGVKKMFESTGKGKYNDALLKLEALILEEDRGDHYVNEAPDAYVPESRRGFSKFIKMEFEEFMLEPLEKTKPVEAGDKYPYQKFIREYMRNASPYRGVLVYHGLGSGKTCTAIAASEALFSTSDKKIIVMTPKSLRKNFLKEITFCGFRHFNLQNHWVALNKKRSAHRVFARKVLNVSDKHIEKANHIWVPDFEQEANYNELSAEEQQEIREQILSALVYDEKTNPTGRIRFISYNGILATKLKKIACSDPTYFDNAVIIIDEIHNLIRLMQGIIDPYLTEIPGKKRKIPLEVVGEEKWSPQLCTSEMKNYKRGYLFYRLLLSAKNSKIIGLSGTPLINFPEELGILANILHGYIPVVEGVVAVQGAGVEEQIRSILTKFKYTDFVEVGRDPAGGGIRFITTLLPEGIQKIDNDTGVERLPPTSTIPTTEEIISMLKNEFKPFNYKFTLPVHISAKPLLPPFPDSFRDNFIQSNGDLKNEIVLVKRLSGLISYYKGSRLDLMPKIVSDEVVRIPMSEYQQGIYSLFRKEEIERMPTKTKGQGFDAIWAEAYNIESSKSGSAYRTATRQMGNFVFPSSIRRPRATADEVEIVDDEIDDTVPDKILDKPDEAFEIPEEVEEEEAEVEVEEEDAVEEETSEEEKQPLEEVVVPIEMKRTLQEILREKKESKGKKLLDDCKSGRKPGETYKDACIKAKQCLIDLPGVRDLLNMENPLGLAIHSPKFLAILRNIAAAPGSSLVYSQFVEMEGIGIFRIVMDVNGYAPIEIVSTGSGTYKFSERTERSFRESPEQFRYITFSGSESDEVRQLALNIFNANFNELPESITSLLLEAGFDNNREGQICRVFCITSAGAEGISLKNVRAVHIMDPHWNEVRLKQVKGRAIRLGSHLDLPESERNVRIFTYLSVFGKDAQIAKLGPMMIDATIRNKDSLERKEAIEIELPIPSESATYTLTSDERLFVISERKKKIIAKLETVMKSAAVDCELNYNQNKDGSFKCLTLEGKVGDFLYHPDLQTDIRESASKFVKTTEKKKVKYFKDKDGTRYAVDESFQVYSSDNLEVAIGKLTIKDGKPNLPVVFY
jgi:hypothetical protein